MNLTDRSFTIEDQMAVPIEELGEKLKKYLKEGRRVTFPWRRGSCAQDKD